MTWYYSAGNQQQGPVDETEYQRLIAEGVITDNTFVWQEGMANWQTLSSLRGATQAAPTTVLTAGINCARCGRTFSGSEVVRVGGSYICAECKPAALQQMREGVVSAGPAEEIRREHIKHEASVKSVGILYFLGAALVLLIGIMSFFAGTIEGFAIGGVFCLLAVAQGWVAVGLRRLQSWARIPTAILSGIGLLGFPLGTLINAYILYLVLCKKGKTVFSPEYQEVIRATPHIKYRTSIVVWILVALLFLALFGGVMALVFNPNR